MQAFERPAPLTDMGINHRNEQPFVNLQSFSCLFVCHALLSCEWDYKGFAGLENVLHCADSMCFSSEDSSHLGDILRKC